MIITRDSILEWIRSCADVLSEQEAYLTQLDCDIGDGDHGANMHRGFQAVLSKLPGILEENIGTLLKTVGMTLVSTVGGASGPLYGTMFMQMGAATAHLTELTLADWTAAMQSGVDGVAMRGKAQRGDKTMLDALVPSLEALKSALARGACLAEAVQASARAAEQGMLETIPLVARKGRASYLGERSRGHQDPGATSTRLLLQVAARIWAVAPE